MPRKPLASARIPQEWMEQIQAICETTGKTPSEVVQEAIAVYLGQPQVNPVNPSENRLLAIERKLDELLLLTGSAQTRKGLQFQKIPERSTGSTKHSEQVDPKVSTTSTEQRLTRLTAQDWLTTGELHQALQAKGFRHSLGTLRRWLKDAIAGGELPAQLSRIGVVANLPLRQASNPKDNSVRWLRLTNSDDI